MMPCQKKMVQHIRMEVHCLTAYLEHMVAAGIHDLPPVLSKLAPGKARGCIGLGILNRAAHMQ